MYQPWRFLSYTPLNQRGTDAGAVERILQLASIALYAVGSALGGAVGGTVLGIGAATIGGALGGALGSYIDATYLFPAKTSNLVGPRIDDFQLQTSSEGSPLRYCLGPENRIAGTVVWIGRHAGSDGDDVPFEERARSISAGGKGFGGSDQTSTQFAYYADFAVALCEGPVNAVRRIWADSKVIFSTGTEDDRYEGITLHTGSEAVVNDATMTNNASPDSHIEAFEGSGEVPKYKNICYAVFDSLALGDFGNRIPTISALVEVEEQTSVRDAIADICARAGLSSGQYDVTRVDECFTGYAVVGPVSMARALEPILQAYDIVCQETEGVLHFFHRGDEVTKTVTPADLAAGTPNQQRPRPVQFSQIANFDAPSAVHVDYIDGSKSYDKASEIAQRINFETENKELLSMPLVLFASKAATIANRRLYRAWTERLAVELTLPPTYLMLQEADVIYVTVEGEQFTLFIAKQERDLNFVLKLSCVVLDRVGVTSTVTTTEGEDEVPDAPYEAPDLTTRALAIPALIDEHTVAPVLYYGAAITSSTAFKMYRGALLYDSTTDVDANFDVVGSPIRAQITIGTVVGLLRGGVSADLWDEASTIEVELLSGSLESVTDVEVMEGKNHALIGSEIIGFRTATLVSANTYRLTGLLRGRRWTRAYIDDHGAAEDFTLLDSYTLNALVYSLGDVGVTRYYRGVANGAEPADETSVTATLNADSMKPFPPINFAGARDGSNNLTMTFERQTRAIWSVASGVEAPLLEGQEVYEIDILDASGGAVVRTITVTDAQTASYTAAEQTTDGLTPGDPVYFEAYMIDEVVGRGFTSQEQSV